MPATIRFHAIATKMRTPVLGMVMHLLDRCDLIANRKSPDASRGLKIVRANLTILETGAHVKSPSLAESDKSSRNKPSLEKRQNKDLPSGLSDIDTSEISTLQI